MLASVNYIDLDCRGQTLRCSSDERVKGDIGDMSVISLFSSINPPKYTSVKKRTQSVHTINPRIINTNIFQDRFALYVLFPKLEIVGANLL